MTNNKYAIIDNNIVINTVIADPKLAEENNWIILPDGVGIGWIFDGTNWTDPNAPTLEILANYARADRDGRLLQTDWTQAADVPQTTKDKYAAYRQALRDVPLQPGFPLNIEWPSKPD